jgi:hypothetical protein
MSAWLSPDEPGIADAAGGRSRTSISQAQAAELTRQVLACYLAYASPSPAGVTMPGAAWLVSNRQV